MTNAMSDPATPIGKVTVIKDFLPPPQSLTPKGQPNENLNGTMERK
jgi:hypothetical protein